jgi:hypothetical protein
MDFVVCAELVVEIKAVEALLPVHEAQLISYLRLTRIPAGFSIRPTFPTFRLPVIILRRAANSDARMRASGGIYRAWATEPQR